MNKNFPECVLYYICNYLTVKEVLACELAFRLFVVPKRELLYRFGREPVTNVKYILKNGRSVKYVLQSYFKGNALHTKVESWYQNKFPITSIITHKICQTTMEANLWTTHVFTQKPLNPNLRELQMKHRCIPMLVQLHS